MTQVVNCKLCDALEDVARERLALGTDLWRATRRGEFQVLYQPEVLLGSGRIMGAEALVRWQHPRLGLLSPGRFIQVAEDTGMILPIGEWVLHESTRQVREWRKDLLGMDPFTISINLSAQQLRSTDLIGVVRSTLLENDMAPDSLKLELTETTLMQDPTGQSLMRLKQLGVQLAIDDFGVGHNSMSYLKRFQVDTLKIDRSFVDGLGHGSEAMAIVRAVITLAKTLNLTVTGEGVETPEHVARLRMLGCDRGQGYYFSQPLTAGGFEELLRRRPRW